MAGNRKNVIEVATEKFLKSKKNANSLMDIMQEFDVSKFTSPRKQIHCYSKSMC